MSNQIRKLLKNISFSMLASIISMIISALVVLIVPKQMTTEGYGYYQLYILYTGYVGFFHFGLIDGIYIRYGGAHYDQLDKKKLFSQNCVLWSYQLLIFAIACILSLSFSKEERLFVLLLTCVEMVLANTLGLLTYVLQATNRIKEGAISSTLSRVVFFVLVLIICFSKHVDFKLVLYADIIGHVVALLYSSIQCKEIVFRKFSDFSFNLQETLSNIRVGFVLMISSIASLLIMGIVRKAIESKWGIETFARVSLTVSVSNLMVQFINAASRVFFPVLRRVSMQLTEKIYRSVKSIFMPVLYASMLFYYPISRLLLLWLPKYEAGLRYMALLFPICIFEGRMSLLNYTYLKTISDIKTIFRGNTSAMIVSFVFTLISVFFLESVTLAMISILIAIGFRCYCMDYFISKKINFNFFRSFAEEFLLLSVFVTASWFINSIASTGIYLLALAVFLLINKYDIARSYSEFKSILRDAG